MIVDCDRCAVRGNSCQDCVITVLLGAPPGGIDLDGTERWALGTLADAGVVPRLQLVDPVVHVERFSDDDERSQRHVG